MGNQQNLTQSIRPVQPNLSDPWPDYPFKDEGQTALFKDPVRTAQ